MATPIQFSKNMRKRSRQFVNSSTRITKTAAKVGLKTLVLGTKVDKGVARSNWRVGIGAPTRAVINAYTPYPKGSKANGQGISETANAFAAIAAGNARIDAVRGVSGVGLTTGIFINNAVPYLGNAMVPGVIGSVVVAAHAVLSKERLFDGN